MNKRQSKGNSTPGNNNKTLEVVALLVAVILEINAVYAVDLFSC